MISKGAAQSPPAHVEREAEAGRGWFIGATAVAARGGILILDESSRGKNP